MIQRLKSLVRTLSLCSLQGLWRLVMMKVRGKELIVTGACIGCGKCCSKINLEAHGRWLRSEQRFHEIVKSNGEFEKFQIIGHDPQGFLQFRCSWLTEFNTCRDHDNRPALCREFPDKNLVLCGGKLPQGCGYAIDVVVPFKKILQQEVERGEDEQTRTGT